MLEKVKALFAQGKTDRARDAFREALRQVCVARFVSGWTGHPLLSPKSAGFLEEVRELSDAPEEPDLNLLLERLLPDFALVLEEALADAKHELGGKASNVDSASAGGFPYLLGWEAGLVAEIAEHAMKAGASERLIALENLSLADLDGDEARARIVDGLLVFEGACGKRHQVDTSLAGTTLGCGDGVPRARLDRMAAHLKALRDAARGISRCRVCAGIIQLGRAGFMRAGYCGAYCAKRGQELYREYVASDGAWKEGRIAVGCVCGATLWAVESEIGTKHPCEACGIEVWIPAPESPKRSGVASCLGCGRAVKASAAKCMYCGRPVGAG